MLADDLIWSTRLSSILREAGTEPVPVRSPDALRAAGVGGAVVDLTARAYDGIEAVRSATEGGTSVVCLAQHDDDVTRRAALAAGCAQRFPVPDAAREGRGRPRPLDRRAGAGGVTS